jgi:copper(I)-binding protein
MTGSAAALMLLLCAGIVSVTGCRSGVPSIEIESPQALLSPYIIGSASVFLEIVNNGNGADTLISARVDIPGTLTELHDTDDGKMVKTEDIPIPPGGAVRLRPGGPHIMIFKLPKDVKTGSTLPLTILFKKSGEKKVSVIIADDYRNSSTRLN